MHYTLVTETWPPEINGVALTVRDFARGLHTRGHAVDVVRPRQVADATGHPGSADMLVRSGSLPGYPGLRFGYPSGGALTRRWRARRPDAVYIATEGPLGWSALRAARRLGIPVATGLHTRFDLYMHDYGIAPLAPVALGWMRRFHNAAAATLVPTMALADELRAQGFRTLRRLPRAVDTKRFSPHMRSRALRDAWGLGSGDLAVIHVGRLAAEKNLPLAIAAFRAIQQRHPTARMVVVGDGPSRAGLQQDNPDMVFCGMQKGRALAQHLASGDLFLFPSRTETFGNVVLEAMASGVPVVAFDTGAAREHLVDGAHGHSVEDDAGFVAASLALADAPETCRDMGLAARQATLALSPATVCADLDRLLAGLGRPDASAPLAAA